MDKTRLQQPNSIPIFPVFQTEKQYEVVKVCEAWGLDKDAYIFNVVKYVARAGKKDSDKELQDMKKALWYLNRKIERLENNS